MIAYYLLLRETKVVLFIFQGNYWSSNVNEVQGFVMDQEGKVIHRLFGKWHEGLYCGVPPSAKCVWRPGERWATAGLHTRVKIAVTSHLMSRFSRDFADDCQCK